MKKNKLTLGILIISLITLITSVSYAIWQLTLTQTDKNTVSTSCFKLAFQEENDIQLENAYPMTYEEGKNLTPYTFTITSLCESNAKYQINLEVLNETTLEDISILKVMLDDKINLLSDKTVVSPTISNAKTSYLLKTGYLRNGESKTFSLRLWMDNDTPPNLEYMNKTFLSKVTITASYLDNLENTITSNVISLNTGYDISETFSIHLTSEKYDIVSISDDGSTFEELEEQGKDLTLEKIINSNGSHTLFVKDEAGNISEVLLNATKVDDQKPISNMIVTKTNNVINIDASSSKDNETSISKYYYSKDGINYEESTENTYEFRENFEYGVATTMLTNYEQNQIKKVYLKTKDRKGNVSDVKEYKMETDFAYDETTDNNLRYVGANPNNYVDFNSEKWRIIGIMNNIDDGTGLKESRIKLVRSESIGAYSWDSSEKTINSGWGINEWSQADAMKLMNPGYENETIGGSLYWERQKGSCYAASSNHVENCDFTTIGLNDNSKEMLKDAIWYLGGNGNVISFDKINTVKFYELERSNNTGKVCTSSAFCNDNVIRNNVWKGKVALVSPSDYGYATSGMSDFKREMCLDTVLYNWDNSNLVNCIKNNWLYNVNSTAWTLNPCNCESYAICAFAVKNTGSVVQIGVDQSFSFFPTLYLKPNVNIVSGNGTKEDSYKLSIS